MSSIKVRDLAPVTGLDRKAMSAIRGGAGVGSPDVKVFVPININQTNNLVQNVAVANNSIIGGGADIKVAPTQMGFNMLTLPSMSGMFGQRA
jgi:hypothetical protein